MAAAKTAYVEDYNSTISEVVPLSRRHAQARKPSTLDTLREGTSDSGYEPSQHSSQLSPIASRAATPANEESSTAQAPQQSSQEQQQQVPQQTQQQTQQQQQAQQQRDQQLRDYYRHQEYQRYYQDRDAQQNASTPMQRRLSSHLSAQTSSSSSSNATPAGSRPNSVKASGSRDSSPAVHKHQTSHGGDNTVDGDSSCDCSQCKTKTSPPAAHSGLNTAWNLNYPPFTTAHHTPPYGPNYANVSPMRSYDYGYAYPPTPASAEPGDAYAEHRRTRDRPIPTRPLSYGGANPVTTSGSWSAYGYYGQAPAASQSYGTPSYAPPPINTAVPATTAGTGPYSAMAGGYSGYVYPSPQEYWASTQATAAVPGSSSSAYEHTMHPPPIPTRRATTRVPSGVQNKSPRNSPGDYHQKYARKYAEEYADNKYSEKYPGGYDRYSRRYTEEYTDKYDDKYADYHQSGAPITRRMSQRTGQGSGAYAHLREEAIPTRSTSVPPSETGPVAPPEERRRTKTPGPPATRMRRDSTSTSGSANAALAGALTRVPKPNEYAIYDDDVYSRTPPSHHGHSRHSSRYDNRYEDYYGHPITPRHQYMYRGSDSSGASSGGVGEDLAVGVSDGETESYTIRRPPKGFPVSLSLPANPRHGNEGQIVENYSNDYRYMPHYEYAPRRTHELAVSHDVSMGGQGRELDKFDVGMPMRRGDTHRARRYSMGGVTRGISPRYSYW